MNYFESIGFPRSYAQPALENEANPQNYQAIESCFLQSVCAFLAPRGGVGDGGDDGGADAGKGGEPTLRLPDAQPILDLLLDCVIHLLKTSEHPAHARLCAEGCPR